MKLSAKTINSPVGELMLVANEKSLVGILWENDTDSRAAVEKISTGSKHPVLKETEKQLREYFAGKRKSFDLPIEFHGTDFQKRVWKALTRIPFGKTSAYGELATRLAAPKASRAVGAATGHNPICIVVPCHRVIGKNGKLTGFAGGLKNKEFLLKLEGCL